MKKSDSFVSFLFLPHLLVDTLLKNFILPLPIHYLYLCVYLYTDIYVYMTPITIFFECLSILM